ncbi:hypothetical protein HELRODRAFT_164368 [Helobdella robusta]|uniref:Uncharacterized protein n=1 Tax=Helobdella robusta TaxID=6412 RepID=T1EVB8_HELRO|nr:hypothetical protein HELRODRAFT_164368 [Helobdella robusta]ESN94512.1 hypothetical protein HELRODRAFT_164368 [Helobdella robusta]
MTTNSKDIESDISNFVTKMNADRTKQQEKAEGLKDLCNEFVLQLLDTVESVMTDVYSTSNEIAQNRFTDISKVIQNIKYMEEEKENFKENLKNFNNNFNGTTS